MSECVRTHISRQKFTGKRETSSLRPLAPKAPWRSVLTASTPLFQAVRTIDKRRRIFLLRTYRASASVDGHFAGLWVVRSGQRHIVMYDDDRRLNHRRQGDPKNLGWLRTEDVSANLSLAILRIECLRCSNLFLECLPLVASFWSSFSSIFHFISFLIVVLYHCYVELARHRCRTYRYFVSCYDTIRYGIEYLTCSEKLTCSQLSPAHGTNRKIKGKKTNEK